MEGPYLLLVEDNPNDQLLTVRALKRHDFVDRIVVANDGHEAMECMRGGAPDSVEEGDVLPSLVLLDLKLPGLDGVEVLQRIKSDERMRRVPVVVLTSSREERDIAQCYDSGANSYVRKPVDYIEFLEVARELQSYWLRLNESPPPASPIHRQ
ncbi:MAG: response regulator [Dehalococcoidia bacterium]